MTSEARDANLLTHTHFRIPSTALLVKARSDLVQTSLPKTNPFWGCGAPQLAVGLSNIMRPDEFGTECLVTARSVPTHTVGAERTNGHRPKRTQFQEAPLALAPKTEGTSQKDVPCFYPGRSG
jgi:hypothetical protein